MKLRVYIINLRLYLKTRASIYKRICKLYKNKNILYSIILTGFSLLYIMLILNMYYLIILLDLISTLLFLTYSFILDKKYNKFALEKYRKLDIKELKSSKLKIFQVILYLILLLSNIIILIFSLIGFNPILIIIAISFGYFYFDNKGDLVN